MRRLLILIALVLVLGLGSYAIFAQQQDQSPGPPQQGMMGRGMGRGMMQGQGGMMMQGGMGCPACGAMCAGVMHQSVTATSDGGVVVSVAGKLIKYDSDLNRVREVNLNIDWTRVHQMAQQFMQNCPMQRGMMQQPQGQPQWQGQPTRP